MQITEEYVKARAERKYTFLDSDPDAVYHSVIDIDVAKIEPQVAFPPLPSNTKEISQVGNIRIDQSVIGSCTNGRIEDLRIAARDIEGAESRAPRAADRHPRHARRCYKTAMKEGLVDIFLDANAVVSPPTCGPCLGGYMGILAEGEKTVSTTNRNFVGRMGHRNSEIYLVSPAIAAASAVLGQDRAARMSFNRRRKQSERHVPLDDKSHFRKERFENMKFMGKNMEIRG